MSFLDDKFYVRWSELTAERVVEDITAALARAAANVDALCRVDRGRLNFESVFTAFERSTEALNQAWGLVGHLDAVCNNDPLRKAYNDMLPKVTEFFTKLTLNESLWDLFVTFERTEHAAKLAGVERRFMEETMAEFRLNGAELPRDKKTRLEAVEAELAQITQKFSENVLDSTNAWELVIDDESRLEGLPDSAREAALAAAKAKGFGTDEAPKWRFTLKAPSLIPVLEHLEDEAIRKEVWQASTTVGRTGEWDNTALIRRILELRREKAALLGKANFPDLVLNRRMAKNGAAALRFVEDLHTRISPAFNRQTRELQEYKAEATHTPAGPLEPWESAFWAEKRRKALYDFDEEELRPYFPMAGVMRGMFTLCETLFEIEIREREAVFIEPGAAKPEGLVPAEKGGPVEVWHPEVKFYEIFNLKGGHLGSFYADWHPRDSKRSGAWMNYLKTGLPPSEEHERTPHLGLIVGNMSPAAGGKPALLTHGEVETVFHEFGHLLHHLLGSVKVKSLNGVNVAWDFVELPSQIMENFCWQRESLDLFAKHYETGDLIPARLFKKLMAARNYMSAVTTMRQLAFARMDLALHLRSGLSDTEDLDAVCEDILSGYLMPMKTKSPTMARRFTHLFASPVGYAAGYYSYKWAEVLDADAFSRFQAEGVLNPVVGRAFRDSVLSRGNSEDPAVLFREFMGRDPDPEALLRRCGLA